MPVLALPVLKFGLGILALGTGVKFIGDGVKDTADGATKVALIGAAGYAAYLIARKSGVV